MGGGGGGGGREWGERDCVHGPDAQPRLRLTGRNHDQAFFQAVLPVQPHRAGEGRHRDRHVHGRHGLWSDALPAEDQSARGSGPVAQDGNRARHWREDETLPHHRAPLRDGHEGGTCVRRAHDAEFVGWRLHRSVGAEAGQTHAPHNDGRQVHGQQGRLRGGRLPGEKPPGPPRDSLAEGPGEGHQGAADWRCAHQDSREVQDLLRQLQGQEAKRLFEARGD
mmetsp:Transcript_20567/g.38347  ORF Transcript_20567/g.38347 Transcript_20567/m.38347 type:complete len:222 (-) Transcript_20567:415-1080(-)